MLHISYCKINEFRAKFIFLESSFYRLDTKTDSLVASQKADLQFFQPIFTEHAHCLPKAKIKLPTWYDARCIFARQPFEQSSSEIVARHRATYFQGSQIASLTGGLGADDVAFALNGNEVHSVDTDPCLNALFLSNCEKLHVKTVQRQTDSAENFIAGNHRAFDLVYADPDRRAGGTRVHGNAALYAPDIFSLMKSHPDFGTQWMVKLSPMTDISWLRERVSMPFSIEVIAAHGEVKEMLLLTGTAQPGITYTWLRDDQTLQWDGQSAPECTPVAGTNFVEPQPGVIKCGFHKNLSALCHLQPENPNQTFFSGPNLIPEWIGRNFELLAKLEGSLSQMAVQLSKNGIQKAHVTARDFVTDSEAARKSMQLEDGGEYYIFLTGKKEKKGFLCRKWTAEMN